MNAGATLEFSAAIVSGALALAPLVQLRRSFASTCFSCGMGMIAVQRFFESFSLTAQLPNELAQWQSLALLVNSFLPAIWIAFSLTYARGDERRDLDRFRLPLVGVLAVPALLVIFFQTTVVRIVSLNGSNQALWISFGTLGKWLNAISLAGNVVALMNLEQTLRSATGTFRWRIKFVVLGLGVVVGSQIYTESEGLLFSWESLTVSGFDAGAILVGCAMIAVAYLRNGFSEVRIYPSRKMLQSSVTMLLAGGYLFAVGMLSEAIPLFRGIPSFELKAFMVLLGVIALAVLLLSDRFQQHFQRFISVHFTRPQHDVREVWNHLTERISRAPDEAGLCNAAARVISDSFNVLSVSIWLLDETNESLVLGSSTSRVQELSQNTNASVPISRSLWPDLKAFLNPFDLDSGSVCPAFLKDICNPDFKTGGHRYAVPLFSGDSWLGIAVLADRANGLTYTLEEIDLLKCIGDQVAGGLLNLRLNKELVQARELEAFQTMSAFLVHDLKNAASHLGLMFENLPVHFNDPEFRTDAIRGVGNAVKRINDLIERVSALRHKLELNPVAVDFNRLVTEALDGLNVGAEVEFIRLCSDRIDVVADREHFQSVIANLVLNAKEAITPDGKIKISTSRYEDRAVLAVVDDGCGMSPLFLKDSLFRPFHSTKKKGMGIGMFQSKMIVEAHRGNIQVESEVGKGTTFRVALPLKFNAA